jgi:hypothetical protein
MKGVVSMNKIEKLKFVGSVFVYGAKSILTEEWVFPTVISMGLGQGFKYNGSLKRGVEAGVITLGVLMTANGIYNVVYHWDKIKNL